MDYRNLGPTGVKVSPLCLGTMMFGAWGNTDHDDCERIIHRAMDAGINFIDTANLYSDGESEEIVAKALRGRREEAVLATKVYWGFEDGKRGPNRQGLSRKAIQEQLEDSLRRLGTEVIDLYLIHRPDPSVPWDETLSTLDDLVRQGKIRYLGCSTNHHPVGEVPVLGAWEIVDTFRRCELKGWEKFCCLQPPYSILRRAMEREHFPMSRHTGLGNMVWSPLEGGWLSGRYRIGAQPAETSPRLERWIQNVEDPKFERRRAAIEKLAGLVETKGVDMAEFSLAWTLTEPAVTSAIIGPRTSEQLEGCLRSLSVQVTETDREAVDAIVPPGETVL
ncbi:MAG: aldo/keto reductase [bacterium]|nr:aldo/keto reductase [bacterium]